MRDELRRRRRQQLKKAARQQRRGVVGPEVGLDRLRGLAFEAPSARVWAQLCAWVDALPGDDRLEVALGYLEAHLEAAGWPDALRTSAGLPQSWLRRAAAGRVAAVEHVAGGAWMRRFDFGEVEEVRLERGSPALWAAWAAAPWRSGLRSLALRDVAGLGGAGLATLLHPRAAWTALEELEVTRCGLDDPDAATLQAAALPALRRLDLRGNLLGPATRRALRAWADAQGIALLLENKEPRDEE